MKCLWWVLLGIAATICDAYPIRPREESSSGGLVDTVFTKPALAVLNFFKWGIRWIWSALGDLLNYLIETFAKLSYGLFLVISISIAVLVICNEFCCQYCGYRKMLRTRNEHVSRLSVITSLPKLYESSGDSIFSNDFAPVLPPTDKSAPKISRNIIREKIKSRLPKHGSSRSRKRSEKCRRETKVREEPQSTEQKALDGDHPKGIDGLNEHVAEPLQVIEKNPEKEIGENPD